MDGFEFLDRIRENPKTAVLPVVLTTSLPEERGKKRALLAGADGYLPKPIPPETFGHTFRRMVKRVRPNLALTALPVGPK
jgi:CheY-like chemotaxis protein